MNKRYLITPGLYNSYIYYVGTDFEKYGDKASEIEAKAKQDFINCLSKIYTSNEILERGIAFENSVNDICNGLPVEPMENAKDVADIVGKGIWQQKLCKTVGDYVLYGKADVIRGDTIYDIKRVNSYDLNKYQNSIQHLLYMECSGIENFKYVVSTGKEVFIEYYHKDADNLEKLLSRINEMIGFIRQTPKFNAAFEKNWHSKY